MVSARGLILNVPGINLHIAVRVHGDDEWGRGGVATWRAEEVGNSFPAGARAGDVYVLTAYP